MDIGSMLLFGALIFGKIIAYFYDISAKTGQFQQHIWLKLTNKSE